MTGDKRLLLNSPLRIPTLIAILFSFAVSAMAQDTIAWITDLNQARRLSQQYQRLVLLHFWSDDCIPCRQVDQNVFNQPEVIRVIATNFIPVKINALQQQRIADFYHVDRVPMDIIVYPNGQEVHRSTSPGRMNDYITMLDQVRAKSLAEGGLAGHPTHQPSLPPMENSLPPRTGGDPGEQPSWESMNVDPRALTGDIATSPNPSENTPGADAPRGNSPRGPWQAERSPDPVTAQKSLVQNQFVTSSGEPPPMHEASVGPRKTNPYLPHETSSPELPAQNRGGAFQPSPGAPGDPAPGGSFAAPPQASLPAGGLPTGSFPGHSNAPAGPPNAWQPPSSPGPAYESPAGNSLQGTLPSETPPVSLDGFCPVTLVVMHKWVKGDPRWGALHRGRTYLMATQADRDRFLTDPDRFSPALSGFDPVRFAESRQLVNGKREWGVYYDQSFFLFADEAALKRFESQPAQYVNAVRQAMAAGRPAAPQR